MQSVTVTFGRNVPTPATFTQDLNDLTFTNVDRDLRETLTLTDAAWADFTTLVRESLEDYAAALGAQDWWIESHDGIGEWEGVEEQSRKLTLIHDGGDLLPTHLERVRFEISLVSARSGFYQDAVSLVYGRSQLL